MHASGSHNTSNASTRRWLEIMVGEQVGHEPKSFSPLHFHSFHFSPPYYSRFSCQRPPRLPSSQEISSRLVLPNPLGGRYRLHTRTSRWMCTLRRDRLRLHRRADAKHRRIIVHNFTGQIECKNLATGHDIGFYEMIQDVRAHKTKRIQDDRHSKQEKES